MVANQRRAAVMGMRMGVGCLIAVLLCGVACGAVTKQDATAALDKNNRGVALMGQQMTERAEQAFAEARALDPKLAQAAVNDGIALLTLQRSAAAQAALKTAIALEPKNAQAWYNLGLVEHARNQLEAALASFQRASALAPEDADSLYFVGVCEQEMHQFAAAIAVYEAVLRMDPLHASAEFGLARCLQRTGRASEAKGHFQRFLHLTRTKIGAPIGVTYGEQGHFSTVRSMHAKEAGSGKMIAVRLVARPLLAAGSAGVGGLTGGGCRMDTTGSGQTDLILMQDGAQAVRVLHSDGHGRMVDLDAASMGLKAAGDAVACAVGDYDGDGKNDLAVALGDAVRLFRNEGKGRFEEVTKQAGLVARNLPSGITFVDYDHDGKLDLLLTGRAMRTGGEDNVLWRNRGDGSFVEQTAATGMGGDGANAAAILTDFNNDRAVDIAMTGATPVLYVNPREGVFPRQPLYRDAALSATVGITVLDFNKDGWMDIAVTHAGAPGLTLWRNVAEGAGRGFERVPLPLHGAVRGWGVVPIDVDNDGWVDLAAIVETRRGAEVKVFRNRGDGRFEDVSRALGLTEVKLESPRGLMVAVGDGATDLVVTQRSAAPVLLHNEGAQKNHFARVVLRGFEDNKTAIGTKVEVFADGLWQKWELSGASGYQTQSAPEILVGLGRAKGIEMLRMLWPTGVLQDEIDLPQTETVAMREADRRGSSCPVVFVWDGQQYRFVTDVIGAGVVGHWFTPTRRNVPRPEEWVRIPGSAVATVDGRVSVRFMEPMEEVNYIDQLRMVAVDHPEQVEVHPDERFLDDPPFASGRVVASEDAQALMGAWDDSGTDVLARLRDRDHRFVSDFAPLPFDGFAKLHGLTLELGEGNATGPLRLLMTGYVNYFSATSLYAAWQAGVKEIPPYIEAQLADGSWKRIVADAGFPAGLERTIVVDLTGKLPAGTRRVRVKTNLQIYWDQIRVDRSSGAQWRETEMPLAMANLRFRGYPKEVDGSSDGDLTYEYNQVSATGPFQQERGSYTHYGDVKELVADKDDEYVVFGSGEEIAAEFDTNKLPPLPAHWKRDYFFYANGYVKDMDWWDASPFTVGQLPFHGMTRYPYPQGEEFPASARSIAYRLQWNDRFVSGRPERLHRFAYRWSPSTPQDDWMGSRRNDGGR